MVTSAFYKVRPFRAQPWARLGVSPEPSPALHTPRGHSNSSCHPRLPQRKISPDTQAWGAPRALASAATVRNQGAKLPQPWGCSSSPHFNKSPRPLIHVGKLFDTFRLAFKASRTLTGSGPYLPPPCLPHCPSRPPRRPRPLQQAGPGGSTVRAPAPHKPHPDLSENCGPRGFAWGPETSGGGQLG